jgi:DNA-directed RNA polymerase subunit RPC12/RpoP
MKAYQCSHCGQKFNSQHELQQHEKECVPPRVK